LEFQHRDSENTEKISEELTEQWSDTIRRIRERTPARVLAGRAGSSYRTSSQLDLREAHAAAVDAVRDELDLNVTLGVSFVAQHRLFEISTLATSKPEFLLRPDLGRRFSEPARTTLKERCRANPDLQIAIGDGLSVAAVTAQVPELLPLLLSEAKSKRWIVGQPFVIRHCRVGILNDIGEMLSPTIAVLLIGERPGLATAESLSAYVAFRPNSRQTDADRNLVSNIHARGTRPRVAATRLIAMVSAMMVQQVSGTKLTLPSLTP